MRRRTFVALVGGAAAWPMVSHAGPAPRAARIGFLGVASSAAWAPKVEAFRAGLLELGYVEGKNFVMEFRWADGKYDRLPGLAQELVSLDVDVIVTQAVPGVRAAMQATVDIPIVIAAVGDAVASHLVNSLARPGGNVTGSSFFFKDISAKRLELLKEAFPHIARVGILLHESHVYRVGWRDAIEDTAKTIAMKLHSSTVKDPGDIDRALESMVREGMDAVTINEDPMLLSNASRIANAAAKFRLPSIGFLEFAEAGGLLAYGADIVGMHRRAATFVDRILKGAKPAALPVEQATGFDFVVNLRTAAAMGLTIPPALLARANKVIE